MRSSYFKKHTFGAVQAFETGIAPFGKAVKTVYLYMVESIIIDTGPHHLEKIVDVITGNQVISTILLTHHHEDHSGNAEFLRKKYSCPVYAHPYAAQKLKAGFAIMPYQRFLFGKAPPTEIHQLPETIAAEGLLLQPYHTPGHSKDHTVYLEKNNGLLFAGDLYLGEKIQFFRVDERMEDQILSLKKVLELDFESLFCGHRPSPRNGKEKLAAKLRFLESFHGKVGLFLHKGYSEREIVRSLQSKNDRAVRLFTMGNASFTNMVHSSIRDHYKDGVQEESETI